MKLGDQTEHSATVDLFNTVFEQEAMGMALRAIDPRDSRWLRVNQKFCDMLGYTREELLQLTSVDISLPDERDLSTEYNKQLLRGELSSYSREKRYLRKDGTAIWTNIWLSAVPDPDGNPTQIISVIQDITEQKLAEETLREARNNLEQKVKERTSELRESEERQRIILDSALDAIITIDASGIVIGFNPAAEKIFGFQSEEVCGQELAEIIIPKSLRQKHRAGFRRYLETGKHNILEQRIEINSIRANGEEFPVELTITPYTVEGHQFFTGFLRDITERKQTELELRTAKEVAESANSAKSEFLSSMSHELRTPMNAILGFAEMLHINSSEPLSEKQKSFVDHILKGGRHLMTLIDDVLELGKIEAGKLSVDFDYISVDKIIDDSLELIQSRAREEGIEILNKIPRDKLPLLWTDGTRLTQALLNILSNAVKYNRKYGTVTLSCEETPEQMLRINVADTGMGITEEKQRDLFKSFERLGHETGDIEGTGIGLTITKQLVEVLGGEIGYQSEVDKGSTFWIDVPISHEQAPTIKETRASKKTTRKAEPKARDDAARTILYIEDNPDNRQLMTSIIAQLENMTLVTADNAELGHDLARSNNPDLILMDLNLPGMNGFEALKRLQYTTQSQDIPVIAITAAALPKDIEKVLKAGFKDYITKPFNVGTCIRVIEETLDDIEISD